MTEPSDMTSIVEILAQMNEQPAVEVYIDIAVGHGRAGADSVGLVGAGAYRQRTVADNFQR